jgi:hypothetical protein
VALSIADDEAKKSVQCRGVRIEVRAFKDVENTKKLGAVRIAN